MYSEANENKIDELLTHYPVKRSAVLPVLYIAQEEHGYVTDEDVKYIARRLDMRVNEVEEVVTFYTMYSRKPVGKYKLQVCRTISCQILGAEAITEHLCRKLGTGLGETTSDGKFTVMEVECLGYCDLAPVLQVNFDYHEQVDTARVDKIVDELV
ncbi:MAG: NADH-quinone oxidoreductase subunit NuoE [Acidobacteria bacterium]|nr:NADH-quinone oxidoreductase subunit NuoE [Acidobacteriota bacterium]MCW5967130.1 NADH-quinone oxidoreductase subunit NuoE [Blastocatellales bacterium]